MPSEPLALLQIRACAKTTFCPTKNPTITKTASRIAKMVLYFIGLGLASEKDITVAGLEVVKRAKRVYLEAYTSILGIPTDKLVRLLFETPVGHALILTGRFLWTARDYSRPGAGRVRCG